MADRAEDALLGLICQAAYCARGPVTAPPGGVPISFEWDLKGYISAEDCIFRSRDGSPGARVYYGILVESKLNPGNFVAAIRGTIDMVEWAENGEFALRRNPSGPGHVETGFHDIYESMRMDELPVIAGILSKMGGKGTITIVGHSLGAALAAYLTRDMAGISGVKVRGRYIALPHPGDSDYAASFDSSVADYVSYAYDLDVVPRIPLGFGYSHLPKTTWLGPKDIQVKIKFDVGCHHHLTSYIMMLDPSLSQACCKMDPSCSSCVRGAAK